MPNFGSFWGPPKDSAPLTEEVLRAAFEKVCEEGYEAPCGTKERPHTVHPRNRDVCIECGWMRPGSEFEKRALAFLRGEVHGNTHQAQTEEQ